MALAMDKRCFCPPLTFVPPWEISLSNLSFLASMNSRDWLTFATFIISSSVKLSLPNIKLDFIVPLNNIPFWGT